MPDMYVMADSISTGIFLWLCSIALIYGGYRGMKALLGEKK